jgi:hypothetical protein
MKLPSGRPALGVSLKNNELLESRMWRMRKNTTNLMNIVADTKIFVDTKMGKYSWNTYLLPMWFPMCALMMKKKLSMTSSLHVYHASMSSSLYVSMFMSSSLHVSMFSILHVIPYTMTFIIIQVIIYIFTLFIMIWNG